MILAMTTGTADCSCHRAWPVKAIELVSEVATTVTITVDYGGGIFQNGMLTQNPIVSSHPFCMKCGEPLDLSIVTILGLEVKA